MPAVKHGTYRVLLVDGDGRLLHQARPLLAQKTIFSQGCDYGSALAHALSFRPDVVVVDLASVDAFTAIENLMAERPTPIMGLYGSLGTKGPPVDPFRSLSLGALDVVELPTSDSAWIELGHRIELLTQVRVVQHVRGKLKRQGRRWPGGPLGKEPPFPLVAIAASLGGPRAMSQILRMVPRGLPAPIVVCQHISTGFTEGLAQWLAAETALPVVEAKDGAKMVPGTVHIAPRARICSCSRTAR
jgi:two-component system chemotaxis response regulator CheB